jgi:hypothetical protein
MIKARIDSLGYIKFGLVVKLTRPGSRSMEKNRLTVGRQAPYSPVVNLNLNLLLSKALLLSSAAVGF